MLYWGLVSLTLQRGDCLLLFPRFGALPWWLLEPLQIPAQKFSPKNPNFVENFGFPPMQETVDAAAIVNLPRERAEARW